MLASATIHAYKEMDPVFLQGEQSDDVFAVLDGSIALFHKNVPVEGKGTHACLPGQHQLSGNVSWLNTSMAMIDWSCGYGVNRWKRYFCSLVKGYLRWFQSKEAQLAAGEINLAMASTCVFIEKGTVGYDQVSEMLDDRERADLDQGQIFAIISEGQAHVFDTRSKHLTEKWVQAIREHIPATKVWRLSDWMHTPAIGASEVQQWHTKIRESAKLAWPEAMAIFGHPVRHVSTGDTFGETTDVMDGKRAYTAMAMDSCVLVQIHHDLLSRDLWDLVVPGSAWTPLHDFLRPEPMERTHNEIDEALAAVEFLPVLSQLPLHVRRGILEKCRSHVSTAEGAVLDRCTPPFNRNSAVPLYIVLQGKLEIYRGHTLLEGGICALSKVSFRDAAPLFPMRVQSVFSGEAWGGAELLREQSNLELLYLKMKALNDIDQGKTRETRSNLQERINAATYTVVASAGTTYITLEQCDWSRLFSEINDVVFRMSTLLNILRNPPAHRQPKQAHEMACLLHGHRFFQQLPFSDALDLAHSCTLMTVDAGTVLVKEGSSSNQILFLLAGTAAVLKSQSTNHLQLQIEVGITVTLEDAPIFFGPVISNLGTGDLFGCDQASSHQHLASSSLVATSRCQVMLFSSQDWEHIGQPSSVFPNISDFDYLSTHRTGKRQSTSEIQSLSSSLSRFGLLRDCPAGLLSELTRFVKLQTVSRGAVLAPAGEMKPELCIIVSGSASIHIRQEEKSNFLASPTNSWNLMVPTPSDLSENWGMCQSVIRVGGSFGELAVAISLRRDTTVIAREPCRLLMFESERMPSMVSQDLKDFLLSVSGVPIGLSKPHNVRSEYDIVKNVGFLSTLNFFKDLSADIVANVSKIASVVSFEKNSIIQTQQTDRMFVHLLYEGKVELNPKKKGQNILLAVEGLRENAMDAGRVDAIRARNGISENIAMSCLAKIASETFPSCQNHIKEIVEDAIRKSAEKFSPLIFQEPEKSRKSKLKAENPIASDTIASDTIQSVDTAVLTDGDHFVLGQAKARERCRVIRIDWTTWQQILEHGSDCQVQSSFAAFSKLKLFSRWKSKNILALAERTKVIKLAKNARLTAKGQGLTDALYVVKAGSCSVRGTMGFQAGTVGAGMLSDDRLYRATPSTLPTDDSFRRLFRCPQCSKTSVGQSSPHQSNPCVMCRGTGTIRPEVLSKTSDTSALHGAHNTGVYLGSIAAGSFVNEAVHQNFPDKTGKLLEHSIVADSGCELYRVEMKDVIEACANSQSLLQGLRNEFKWIDDRHNQRQEKVRDIHSRLQEHLDRVVHPRPKEDLPGEKPNHAVLKTLHRRTLARNTWDTAHGTRSCSRSGQFASRLLSTPLPQNVPTKLLDFVRLPQSIDERRHLALGPHNLSKVKAKHETAQEMSSKPIDGSRQESGKPVLVDDGTQKVLTLSSRHDAVQTLSDNDIMNNDTCSRHENDGNENQDEKLNAALDFGGLLRFITPDLDPSIAESWTSVRADDDDVKSEHDSSLATRSESSADEVRVVRNAKEVYYEYLGDLTSLHSDLLRSLPSIGVRGKSKGLSGAKDRHSSYSRCSSSLTNFQCLQDIYAKAKNLGHFVVSHDDVQVKETQRIVPGQKLREASGMMPISGSRHNCSKRTDERTRGISLPAEHMLSVQQLVFDDRSSSSGPDKLTKQVSQSKIALSTKEAMKHQKRDAFKNRISEQRDSGWLEPRTGQVLPSAPPPPPPPQHWRSGAFRITLLREESCAPVKLPSTPALEPPPSQHRLTSPWPNEGSLAKSQAAHSPSSTLLSPPTNSDLTKKASSRQQSPKTASSLNTVNRLNTASSSKSRPRSTLPPDPEGEVEEIDFPVSVPSMCAQVESLSVDGWKEHHFQNVTVESPSAKTLISPYDHPGHTNRSQERSNSRLKESRHLSSKSPVRERETPIRKSLRRERLSLGKVALELTP